MDDDQSGRKQDTPDAGVRWHLRAARPGDAAACAVLAVVAWQRVHDSYIALLGSDLHELAFSGWQGAKADAVGEAIRQHPDLALVATAGEAIVGFVTYEIDAAHRIGEIGNNAVDPAWQGRGIATALYRAALERMRAAGLRGARVRTGLDDGHAAARAAYERVGFQLGLPSIMYYQDLFPATVGDTGGDHDADRD